MKLKITLILALSFCAAAQNPGKCGNGSAPDFWCEYVGQACVWGDSACPNNYGLADVWQCHWTDPTFGAESCTWTWLDPNQPCNPTCKNLVGTARPAKDRWWWKHGRRTEIAFDKPPEPSSAWSAIATLKTLFTGLLPNGPAGMTSNPYGYWLLKGESH